MENYKLKLNLIGIGKISTDLVFKMYDESDCFVTGFNENFAEANDLESNEKEFLKINFSIDEKESIEQISETFCFIDAKEGCAGAALIVLEYYKEKPITIFILKDNCTDPIEFTNSKIIINVMQEYARSGIFRSAFLFDLGLMKNIIINSLPENDEFTLNDINNLLIDKVIYGAHIYWRLLNEKYFDGYKIDFDETIYKTNIFNESINLDTFFDGNEYYKITKELPNRKIWVVSIKEKFTKSTLTQLEAIKKMAKEKKIELVVLKDEESFFFGIYGTSAILESNYLE